MSDLGDGITWADWVRQLAAERGVHNLSDDAVDWLLWERTPWPVYCGLDVLRPMLIEALDAIAQPPGE